MSLEPIWQHQSEGVLVQKVYTVVDGGWVQHTGGEGGKASNPGRHVDRDVVSLQLRRQ